MVRKAVFIAMLGLFLVLYVVPLEVRPFVTPDEFRYAEIPRGMLSTGDWVTPRLDGLLYFEKPVMGYWMNALSMVALGKTRFAVRLPAAVSAGLSALLLIFLMRRAGQSAEVAGLTTVILLTTLQFFVIGVFAVLDGPFTMFTTATMVSFFAAYTSPTITSRRVLLGLAGIACGFAFLTKGFIALAVPGLAIFFFLMLERKQVRSVLELAWIPTLTVSLVVLPWAFIVNIREPSFWPYFIWTEHIQRYFSAGGPQHPEPIWFFLPVFAIGALPWSPLIPAALSGLRTRPSDPLTRFAGVWFVSTFVFFSASSGKLATYILPAFPAFAVLMSIGISSCQHFGRRRLWQFGTWLSALIAATGAVFFVVFRETLYGDGNQWRGTMIATALSIWLCFALVAGLLKGARRAIAVYAAAPLVFLFSLHLALPVAVIAADTPDSFLAQYKDLAEPGVLVVSDLSTVHAACWAFDRQDIVILGKPGELSFGLEKDPTRIQLETKEDIEDLLRTGRMTIILMAVNNSTFTKYKYLFPVPVFQERNGGIVVAEFHFPRGIARIANDSG